MRFSRSIENPAGASRANYCISMKIVGSLPPDGTGRVFLCHFRPGPSMDFRQSAWVTERLWYARQTRHSTFAWSVEMVSGTSVGLEPNCTESRYSPPRALSSYTDSGPCSKELDKDAVLHP